MKSLLPVISRLTPSLLKNQYAGFLMTCTLYNLLNYRQTINYHKVIFKFNPYDFLYFMFYFEYFPCTCMRYASYVVYP